MRGLAMLSFVGLCLCAAVMGGCSTVTYEVQVMNQSPQTREIVVDWPLDRARFTLNQGQTVAFKAKIDKDVLPSNMTFTVAGLPVATYPLEAEPSTTKIFGYIRDTDILVRNDKTTVREESIRNLPPKVEQRPIIRGNTPTPTPPARTPGTEEVVE
ncbi:MAG: hypothetical protein ACE15C_11820 [Phycisphaerae bacterium]